jgi:hypothetical protein
LVNYAHLFLINQQPAPWPSGVEHENALPEGLFLEADKALRTLGNLIQPQEEKGGIDYAVNQKRHTRSG